MGALCDKPNSNQLPQQKEVELIHAGTSSNKVTQGLNQKVKDHLSEKAQDSFKRHGAIVFGE